MAHQLLDREDGHVSGDQQHTEGVTRGVVGDGLLHSRPAAPTPDDSVGTLVRHRAEHILTLPLPALQQRLGAFAQRDAFHGARLALPELQLEVLAVASHVSPPQCANVAEAQPCQAREQEHRLHLVALPAAPAAHHPPELRLRQEPLLLPGSPRTLHPLQHPLVEKTLPVCLVEHARQLLEEQAHRPSRQVFTLHIPDEFLQVWRRHLVQGGVTVSTEVLLHQPVAPFCRLLDALSLHMAADILHQAYSGLLLRLAAAKAGCVTVALVLPSRLRRQFYTYLPVGSVMDGLYNEMNVGVYRNIHNFRVLYCF